MLYVCCGFISYFYRINKFPFFHSEGHIGLERKVTKLEAMVKMLQEDLKKVREKKNSKISKYLEIHTI